MKLAMKSDDIKGSEIGKHLLEMRPIISIPKHSGLVEQLKDGYKLIEELPALSDLLSMLWSVLSIWRSMEGCSLRNEK